jgi:hypothetical protein
MVDKIDAAAKGSKWSSSVANENSAVFLNFGVDIRPRGLSEKFIAALPPQLDGRGAASEKTAPLARETGCNASR